ncbi:unnamed protein product [Scytosiphon promiscuus]
MSKKAGKKTKVKVPEVDPNSPEWIEEVARKQSEAYELVQRAMIRSQIDVELTTRDDLVKQKAELETKAKQQSQDQSDIYQYLRNKLKDNYVAIAELENQVSHAHDERLVREKQLLTTIKNLDEEREREKKRLGERLASLEVELTAIKEYQDNSEVYEQKLKDMEAKIAGCKDALNVEVALLNSQLEEEWETGRRDKEERRKVTKKAAAKATQEQLGPRTKHRIAQNKKMMSELRFQCFEVEKMHRARQGLMKSNTLLLAQAASARYRVEDLARRSHLLQRIIRYMNQKVRGAPSALQRGRRASNRGASTTVRTRHLRRGWSPGLAGSGREAGDRGGGRGEVGESGVQYKLAGMSEEERQEMLDLREELRREEVSIAAAQTVAGELRDEMLRVDQQRSRLNTLKTDLARNLALCHEDPLLGTDGQVAPRATSVRVRQVENCQPEPLLVRGSSASSTLRVCESSFAPGPLQMPGLDLDSNNNTGCATGSGEGYAAGTRNRCTGSGPEVPTTATLLGIDDDGCPQKAQRQDHRKDNQDLLPQQKNYQRRRKPEEQHQLSPRPDDATLKIIGHDETGDREICSAEGRRPNAAGMTRSLPCRDVGGLALWPENVALPSLAVQERAGENNGPMGGGARSKQEAARQMSAGILRGVARLFLSKLQVSVEEITPRPLATEITTSGFPSLASGTSLDDGGSAFGVSTNSRQLGLSRRGPRNQADSRRAKRKGMGGSSTAGANGIMAGQRLRRDRGAASSCGAGGGEDGGDQSNFSGACCAEPRGARHGHEPSASKRLESDDATSSWSKWHPTGIPSWDILESAVRKTKRQRTRDAACQTLTYRQLRDGANTTASKRNTPTTSCKHAGDVGQPTPSEAQQLRPRQEQQHQDTRFHVVPASRFVSMLNPPSCLMSSDSSVSTASVYRVTDGGGIVHGAIVRGGTHRADGQMRRGLRQRGDGMAGRVAADGDAINYQGPTVDGSDSHSATDGDEGRRSFTPPPKGGDTVLCTPSKSSQRQRRSPLHDQHRQQHQELAAAAQPSDHRPEATGGRRLSPTLGQVGVSWGRDTGHVEAETMQGNGSPEPEDPAVLSCSRGGIGARSLQNERDALETGYYGLLSNNDSAEQGGSAGSKGFTYESLSKGPDYRKVLLFTVNDADCRILRRSRASPARLEQAGSTRADGSMSRRDSVLAANGGRCSHRSPSRQRGRVAAGTNIIRSLSSPAAAKAVEERLAESTASENFGGPSVGLGLFIGKSSSCNRQRSSGGTGRKGSTCLVKNGSTVWEKDGSVGGPDGGRTFCSSVSTLSGEAF